MVNSTFYSPIAIALYLVSFLLLWHFAGYPLAMTALALWARPREKKPYHPFVSVVVAAYNEEKNIEKRIENLLELAYPQDKYEIIIVDDASQDETARLVARLMEKRGDLRPPIKLLRQPKRQGKAQGIKRAREEAGDFLLITDANCLFHQEALKELMPHFQEERVGAVNGRWIISNPQSGLASSEAFHYDFENILFQGEALLDSVSIIDGTIGAVRKPLAQPDGAILTEDLDMAIKIRRAGYKVAYEPKALVFEPAATTIRDQFIQKRRTCTGTIQCLFRHWSYFFLPRDLYSAFIFPSHKTLAVLSPFLLLAIPILYAFSPLPLLLAHLLGTALAFLALFGLLTLLRSKALTTKTTFSPRWIPRLIFHAFLIEVAILLAWKDYFLRRYTVLWERAQSART